MNWNPITEGDLPPLEPDMPFLAYSDVKPPENRRVVAKIDGRGRIVSIPGAWAVPNVTHWLSLPGGPND